MLDDAASEFRCFGEANRFPDRWIENGQPVAFLHLGQHDPAVARPFVVEGVDDPPYR